MPVSILTSNSLGPRDVIAIHLHLQPENLNTSRLRPLFIKPLQLIPLPKNRLKLLPSPRFLNLLHPDTMQARALGTIRHESPEHEITISGFLGIRVVGIGIGQEDLAEEMQTVGRGCETDGHEVRGGEVG